MKKIALLLTILCAASLGCKNDSPNQKTATIIFMIGTPSSGKTSIAKALKKQLEQPYLYAPTDIFVDMLPSSYIEMEPQHKQGIYFIKDASKSELRTYVKLGPIGQKLVKGVTYAIAGLARSGLNVISEGVIWEKTMLQEFARGWKDFRVFFIHINPSLEEAERRESHRKDWFGGGERIQGQVRGAYEAIQTFGNIYDLEIDTTNMTAAQGAEKIIAFMQANPKPVAFKKLV